MASSLLSSSLPTMDLYVAFEPLQHPTNELNWALQRLKFGDTEVEHQGKVEAPHSVEQLTKDEGSEFQDFGMLPF